MRYRQMTPDGDYSFIGASRFLVNTPATVAQAVLTRLRLYRGEWFLDDRIGLDKSQILGYNTATTRDAEIQRVIVETEGVRNLLEYSSYVEGRDFKVAARIDTIYGVAEMNEVL